MCVRVYLVFLQGPSWREGFVNARWTLMPTDEVKGGPCGGGDGGSGGMWL
jgi:hypothetical protein